MRNILVIGSSGHARVIIDAVERQNQFRIVGIIDTFKPVGFSCVGYQVLGDELRLIDIIRDHDIYGGVIAIGDNWVRHQVADRIRCAVPSFEFVTVIHPSAQVARSARVAAGTVVMPGAIISANADIGECCIVNTKASLDHDGMMGAFSSFAPAVTAGGEVTIKPFAAVLLGANIIHTISIGEHSVVGAGSLVLRDVPDRVVAYGLPARVIRARQPGDPYLRVNSGFLVSSETVALDDCASHNV
jgi:sugar O-acyltransferase (sialic acid O-acetyltransferase NeuD family)